MRRTGLALLLCALLSTPFASEASLTQRDWKATGDGLLTFDSQSGLNWLDLTVTVNTSYNAVTQMLAPTGALHGFRYATEAELVQLFSNAGMPSPSFGAYVNTGLAGNVLALMNLLGQTGFPHHGYAGPNTGGIYGEAYGANAHRRAQFGVRDSDLATTVILGDSVGPAIWWDDQATVVYGSYLVQTAVPEPGSFALLLSGLGITAFIARRRRA